MNKKSASLTSSSYSVLLSKVKKTLIEGQARIEQERVRTYWETGRLIHTHILQNKDRAQYGAEVLAKLANDLGVQSRLLQRCVQFAKVYPRLPNTSGGTQFNWSHYRTLITVTDSKGRKSFEKKLAKNNWSAEELALRIKDQNSHLGEQHQETSRNLSKSNLRNLSNVSNVSNLSKSTLIQTPKIGPFHTYQIIERPSLTTGTTGLRVDLGFGCFYKVAASQLSQFAKGDIVVSSPKEDAYKFVKSNRTAKDLYTYWAEVERVIDGDTLKVRFDLGFNMEIRQTLRLRGLDCPELDTKEGQLAKTFVQAHVKEETQVIVRTTRADKYDRYLADVFIPLNLREDKNAPRTSKEASRGFLKNKTSAEPVYLNNLLLENGHAVRMG